jgi:hypothetical protein
VASAEPGDEAPAEESAAGPAPGETTDVVQEPRRPEIPFVDEALADSGFRAGPRALLLLRICQFAQIIRPDVLQRYWPRLVACGGEVPVKHQEAFEALRAAVEPPAPAALMGFAGQIVGLVNQASASASTDPQAACRGFSECEQRLRKRWWPFGKRPAWVALVQAWADVDRRAALERLHRLPGAMQENLIQRLNDRTPLTTDEWDLAHRSVGTFGSVIPVVNEMLERDNPVLHLSETLAQAVAKGLRETFNQVSLDTESSRTVDADREKAISRYFKLVACHAEDSVAGAESLMEEVFAETATTPRFGEQWPDRFTTLRQLINEWVGFAELRPHVPPFLAKSVPAHLRDFCLAHWHAMSCGEGDDPSRARQSLEQSVHDKANAEAWFLVTLVRRGLGAEAVTMARASARAEQLVPRLRRTWLCEHPETASVAFATRDFKGDPIGQFLFLAGARERMEFLRKRTGQGGKSLPSEMWKMPGVTDLVGESSGKGLERWYTKNEPENKQFSEYLRLHGYGHYCHEELDPYLLGALIAWDEEHPDEAKSVLEAMWNAIRISDTELSLDLLRNTMFTRCKAVLAARPELFVERFIKWLKKKLVDNQVRRYEGDTIYTFSLKGFVPFLYCLLGAQALAKFSPSRCDELITCAIRDFEAEEDLMIGAAELYASDKGLGALTPPASLRSRSHLEAWQMGVVEASMRRIIEFLVGGDD